MNNAMKETLFNCYKDSGKSRSKFIHLCKMRTGLTDCGMAKDDGVQVLLKTLIFTKK